MTYSLRWQFATLSLSSVLSSLVWTLVILYALQQLCWLICPSLMLSCCTLQCLPLPRVLFTIAVVMHISQVCNFLLIMCYMSSVTYSQTPQLSFTCFLQNVFISSSGCPGHLHNFAYSRLSPLLLLPLLKGQFGLLGLMKQTHKAVTWLQLGQWL